MEEIKQAFHEVMYKYKKPFGNAGVEANLQAWQREKSKLLALLRRHPQWVENEKAVVIRFTEGRGIEQDVVDETAFTLLDIAQEQIPQVGFAAFRDAFNAVVSCYATTLPEEALQLVREHGGIKCATGQKASRILGSLCRQFGVDRHPRYNAVYAQIADALNPLQITRTAILSVHPCDFLEMSNRDNTWTSCHGLSSGGYQMGTLSYMTDDVSMVLYTVDNDVQDHFYRAPRHSRQVYIYKDNALYQSRMYPSDASDLMNQYRSMVQKVIATCLGVPNLWTLKKERTDINAHIETADGSMQYPDYCFHGNFSVLKNTDLDGIISVGAPPLCVCCGNQITIRRTSLQCDCENVFVCKECGETVSPDNCRYRDGAFYCKKCLHICASCGNAVRGEMYPAFDRRGRMVQVCAACHAVAMSPCGRCSVQGICRIIGRNLCPRAAVNETAGGAA